MLKLWLVIFSNGEEWYIFGEKAEVEEAAMNYLWNTSLGGNITFIRAYK